MSERVIDTAELTKAAELVGPAMIGDPGFTAILGGDDPQEERTAVRFFEAVFHHLPGELVSIRRDGGLLGVLRRIRWPDCQLSREEGQRIAPILYEVLQERVSRLGERSRVWAKHEPRMPHWHLAPMAVAPAHQGQGVGSELLDWFCNNADADKLPAYLETSKIENTRLYERFGFVVQAEADAIGVPHWFMWREPR